MADAASPDGASGRLMHAAAAAPGPGRGTPGDLTPPSAV